MKYVEQNLSIPPTHKICSQPCRNKNIIANYDRKNLKNSTISLRTRLLRLPASNFAGLQKDYAHEFYFTNGVNQFVCGHRQNPFIAELNLKRIMEFAFA